MGKYLDSVQGVANLNGVEGLTPFSAKCIGTFQEVVNILFPPEAFHLYCVEKCCRVNDGSVSQVLGIFKEFVW